MTIKIDKNVPCPPQQRRGGRPFKYPFPELEVGDSFFVAKKTTATFASTVSSARKRLGITLVTRTVEEDGVSGVRVWRVG